MDPSDPKGRSKPGGAALFSLRFALYRLLPPLCTVGWALALLAAGPAFAVEYSSTVLIQGLNSPRQLAFAPDGSLYVTEAGIASGTGPTTIVRGETNTYTETGSVTRYAGGVATRVVTGLPSIYGATSLDVVGPNGIAFGAGGTLAIAIGGGVNPLVRATDLAPLGVDLQQLRLPTGTVDLGMFEAVNNPAGGPIDSDPWHVASMQGGAFLVTDAGGNSLLRVDAAGTVSLVASFASRALGGPRPTEPVPTGVALGPDGAIYVSELTGFPFVPGAARIYRIAPGGTPTILATGFTMLSDLAFAADGTLYALEYDSNGLLVPGDQGALWKVNADGSRTLVYTDSNLVNPTGLAIRDGTFYVSDFGHSSGHGEVLAIAAVPEPGTWALLGLGIGAIGWARRRGGRGGR
jgi:sugar lactone lactonase YvrE